MNTIGSVIVLFLLAGLGLIFWVAVLGASANEKAARRAVGKADSATLGHRVASGLLEVTAALLTVAPLVVLLIMAAKAALA